MTETGWVIHLDRNQIASLHYCLGFVLFWSPANSPFFIADVDFCCGLFAAAFGKRSWKMFYCTLRDLVLYLHKDEHGFRKNQLSDNVHNAIRIHHALATRANDYTKKQHVFRLQTADQSEYLFQTSDSKELDSWVETINYVCAAFSAPPLEGGVGSQKRYQRPLLPTSRTRLLQVGVYLWVKWVLVAKSVIAFAEGAIGDTRGQNIATAAGVRRA